MITLFNLFVKENDIRYSWNYSELSRLFNSWITKINNARNKKISNEATKFQIRKWAQNGKINWCK